MFGLPSLPRTLAAATRDVGASRRDVRLSALRDLARLSAGDDRAAALAALAAALSDREPAVRGEAAVALADAKAHEQVSALVGAARDDNLRVRQMALMALGEVAPPGHERARAVIERALDDDSPEIRFQALVALHHVTHVEPSRLVRSLSDDDALIRHITLRIAEERWLEAASPLPDTLLDGARRALDDASPGVSLAAAILLAKAGDDAGHARIAAVVGAPKSGVDAEDEQTAVELAGELRIEAARLGLERRAFGPLASYRGRFTWHARVALAKMGDARARDAIVRGLGAWSRDARTLAVAAAGRARVAEALPIIEAMRDDATRADPDAVGAALEELARGAR